MKHLYSCSCGQTHERDYGFSESKPSSIACSCGKRAKRKLGVPNVIYRGPGFTKSNTFKDE